MQTGSREASVAAHDPSIESSPSLLGRPLGAAAAAATAGAWLGMVVSVLGWFDEPLEVWFEVSKVATAVGACAGLGLAAALTAVRAHGRHDDEDRVPVRRYDVISPHRG
ncbi:hypothetical protein [Kribbella flavida]|uniref:hypothetical protein n=1 Tax=Kribbella flavida TaxID=182640 RepID=UPI00019BDD72|nr:hypothetical protein [Kribbella flavida]